MTLAWLPHASKGFGDTTLVRCTSLNSYHRPVVLSFPLGLRSGTHQVHPVVEKEQETLEGVADELDVLLVHFFNLLFRSAVWDAAASEGDTVKL